jgi:hypothetical protein
MRSFRESTGEACEKAETELAESIWCNKAAADGTKSAFLVESAFFKESRTRRRLSTALFRESGMRWEESGIRWAESGMRWAESADGCREFGCSVSAPVGSVSTPFFNESPVRDRESEL